MPPLSANYVYSWLIWAAIILFIFNCISGSYIVGIQHNNIAVSVVKRLSCDSLYITALIYFLCNQIMR